MCSIRLVITYSEQRAKELCENYSLFDRDILYFPAKDLIFFQADIHGNLLEQQRLAVLKALTERRTLTVVTTMSACMNHLMPHDAWTKEILLLAPGDTLDMEEMKHRLTFLGYERMGQVDAPGQFAVRGGILDIYPLTDENPVRIELWGDEIDSIRSFDVQSQRSLENLESLTLYPAAELLPSARQREAVVLDGAAVGLGRLGGHVFARRERAQGAVDAELRPVAHDEVNVRSLRLEGDLHQFFDLSYHCFSFVSVIRSR